MKQFILILLFVVFSSYHSRAQYSFNASVTGTIVIAPALSLNYTALVGTFAVNDIVSYYNGVTTTNAATIAVTGNTSWIIKVSANSNFFTAQGGGASATMPASVLGVRLNGSSTFLSMSTTAQTLNMGNPGAATVSGNTFNIDMFFNPGFSYPGGNYSLGLLFTLTSQ